MIAKYLKPYRENLFPEIKDFSDPMNHLRNAKAKDLSLAEIVWFKPSFYKDFTNSFTILMTGFILTMLIYFIAVKQLFGVLIFSIMLYVSVRLTYRTIKNNEIAGRINLYDLLVRDMPLEGEKVRNQYGK